MGEQDESGTLKPLDAEKVREAHAGDIRKLDCFVCGKKGAHWSAAKWKDGSVFGEMTLTRPSGCIAADW